MKTVKKTNLFFQVDCLYMLNTTPLQLKEAQQVVVNLPLSYVYIKFAQKRLVSFSGCYSVVEVLNSAVGIEGL